jgi:two-component system response regulator PilR (NtrC family)
MSNRVLIADDEKGIRESLGQLLREEGYETVLAADGNEAIRAIDQMEIDLVITDIKMPGRDGLEVVARVREVSPQTLIIIITAYASIETAVAAIRQGAHDYIIKPLLFEDLLSKVNHLFQYRNLATENQMLRREIQMRFDFENIIAKSKVILDIFELIKKVAPTKTNVLITGESGVGKELVARAIHYHSRQRDKVFLPVNCSAIPENLLESQLFGHLKGSFTGAISNQEGLFQKARGGTIFLDEIGDMPLPLQGKILRAIEEKEILPVGSSMPSKVDVRILAATNRDLKAWVEEGKFRQDLYYRLNVVGIQLPPLRDRREDIPILVEHFVRKHNMELKKSYKGVDNRTMKLLMALPWKGNVRELDNVIEHSMILGEGEWITLSDLPGPLRGGEIRSPEAGENLREALKFYERVHIETLLKKTHNDKRMAADLLGVSLSSLYRKIEELDLQKS